MRNAKWVVYAVALGMMALTARWLDGFRKTPHLGRPGVRLGAVPIYDDNHNLVSDQSIVLPVSLPGMESMPVPVTTTELNELPKDTLFGRRFYKASNDDFAVEISVVLMGTDHTSIHQPQYCLYGQNWTVTDTERVNLRMDRPFADIPAIKMTANQQFPNGQIRDGVYVYWFVSGDKITAEEGSRLWSMWKTVLQKGEMERWAYISYFVTCVPGGGQATFERLEKFIRASAPEFQLVKSNPPDGLPPMTARK